MKIANPIYDAAFKYLMEDTDVARQLIGRIIGEEIVEMVLNPQELQIPSEKYLVIILRMDFKATIKTASGEYKKVLIEIQKGKDDKDIIRFRRYLGKNYRDRDYVKMDDGEIRPMSLPVIPIYFLGFNLSRIPTPVMKANRHYKDLILGQELKEKEDFVEQLTHDGYFIQIPRLQTEERNELEGILQIFNQAYRVDDGRLMELPEGELKKYPLLKKLGERLYKAAASQELLDKMELEEEVEETIEYYIRKSEDLREAVEKQEKDIEEKEKTIEEKEKTIEEKEKTIERQKETAVEQLIRYSNLTDEEIAQLQNTTMEKVRQIRKRIND